MLEIAPKSYLDSLVNQKLKNGEHYEWHSRKVRETALEKAKSALLAEYNGWPSQAEKLKKEVLSCLVEDRALGTVSFINSAGGKAKIFAVVNNLTTRVSSFANDWVLKPVADHAGQVPTSVGLMAARLKQNGFSFDDWLVAEPIQKPAVPKGLDPVLVGALASPAGYHLVEVGRWDGFISASEHQYNVELGVDRYDFRQPSTAGKKGYVWIFRLGIPLAIGVFWMIFTKGFFGALAGAIIAGLISYAIVYGVTEEFI